MAETTALMPRQLHWSSSPGGTPMISEICYNALVKFFHQKPPNYQLAVATEASSHPSGLDSLFAQPWVYGGGGLGNIDECPMQVCVAGGVGRDSMTFASVCVVPECVASDLAAVDFPSQLKRASTGLPNTTDVALVNEYITLNERIAQINKFLKSGWVCGEYKVDWEVLPSIVYVCLLCLFIALSCIGTYYSRKKYKQKQHLWQQEERSSQQNNQTSEEIMMNGTAPLLNGTAPMNGNTTEHAATASYLHPAQSAQKFWSAWDMSKNLKKLCVQRRETACLDGLKLGSILWVISGHVMAIQSSSGAGYLNPSEFLPPNGVTTKWYGQLLFSARFAVDTFLSISGYLVVTILKQKFNSKKNVGKAKLVISSIVLRILRILPLYAMCVGFWMYLAPHMGSGPFWYQWHAILEPCRKYWWTNALFINNFVPWDSPTTDTCFYHSWYLAIDVQLFILFGPWLVLLYQRNAVTARSTTVFLWCLSVIVTALLTYHLKWSINTFDGHAVALFDVEGYAKPHVRAQSYLAGMLVAMMPPTRKKRYRDNILMVLALFGLCAMTFITVTGAYSRRACNFGEWPSINGCGSTWSFTATFLYAAFSRAIWSICIATIMHLCLENRGKAVEKILSWNLWTPLAQLSYGAYLIHPIVIFVWKLGGREKVTFRLFSFFMDLVSITVVSFILSALGAIFIEFPISSLLRQRTQHKRKDEYASLMTTNASENITQGKTSYGSTSNGYR